MKVRHLLALAAATLLCGCSSQTSIWSQYVQVVRASYRNWSGQGVVPMEQAAAIPYASLAYRLNGGSEAMLVLATDANGDQLWTAASRVVFQTHDGRIRRSVGLPHDLGGLVPLAQESLPPPAQALRGSYSGSRIADFPDIGVHDMRLNCVTAAKGRQIVTILGTALVTIRIDETCESRTPRWSFTDSYWVDADSGFVWQSRQHLHPSGTVVQVKILRPPE